MTNEKNTTQKSKTAKSERYLNAVFKILKKREAIVLADRQTHFNDTEIRLIGEILSEKYEGRRLISTQLAQRLGVTRSAISQIVNRLESEGVVRRVPDEVDKKIAYIEVTGDILSTYQEDVNTCLDYIQRVVEKFGEDRFEQMYALITEFMDCLESEKEGK